MNKSQKPNIAFNSFNITGRLCNTPIKDFTKNKQLFTRFVIKTKYDKEIYVPLIMFGQEVDVVCTKYQIGDIVTVKGFISTREVCDEKLLIDFIVTEMMLLTKAEVQIVEEDKFLKVVELYDLNKVTKRMIK